MGEWDIRYKLLDTGDYDAPAVCEAEFSRGDETLALFVDPRANVLFDEFLRRRGLKRGDGKPARREATVHGEDARGKLGGFDGRNLAVHEIREDLGDGKHRKGKRKKSG